MIWLLVEQINIYIGFVVEVPDIMVSKVILVISLSLSQFEQLLLVTQVWPHSVLFVLYQLGRPTLK